MLTFSFEKESYIELPVGFAITMGGIMSQRLLLDVRKYHSGDDALDRSQRFGGRVVIAGHNSEFTMEMDEMKRERSSGTGRNEADDYW